MKKKGIVISLVLIAAMIISQAAVFADGLSVTAITPKDGATGKQPQNMAVKVTFSQNVTAEDVVDGNLDKFTITDPDGNEQALAVVYDAEKYPDQLWLILEDALVASTDYTVTVKSGIAGEDGSVLGSDFTSTFRTRNTKIDSAISTAMMFGMMALMMFFTFKSQKAEQDKQVEIDRMNPYKVAKVKGISLEEAQALVDKEKVKQARKAAKAEEERQKLEDMKASEIEKIEAELDSEERRSGYFRVKARGSLRAHGGTIPKSVIRKNKIRRKKKEAEQKRRLKNKKKK